MRDFSNAIAKLEEINAELSGQDLGPVVAAAMTTVDVLLIAREMIANPENWVRGEEARRAGLFRRLVDHSDADAVRFSTTGAIFRVCDDADVSPDDALSILSRALSPERVINDFSESRKTKHADIIALFDRAIAAARARGKGGQL